MSYYSSNRSGNGPGPITNGALNGLCERACIQTNKVLDACLKQVPISNLNLQLQNINPANPTLPLTFVGMQVNGTVNVLNLVIDRLQERPNFARVTFTANVPVVVAYQDNLGVAGTGEAFIDIPVDVILFIPQPSVVPYSLEVFSTISGATGRYVSDYIFNISACVSVIVRVLVKAEILVPSYGYCLPPVCQNFNNSPCSGAGSLPIYPTAL